MRSALEEFQQKSLDLTLPKEMDGPRVFSTGNLWLDNSILTVGGFCRGLMTELFGRESSGKSTICLHVAANAQKAGFKVAYLDTEGFLANSWGREYAGAVGVDLDPERFKYWYEVGPAETLFQGMRDLMMTGEYGLAVIDSLAFLRTASQLNAMTLDPSSAGKVADFAGTLTRWCPVLAKAAWDKNVCLIVTNQMRVNMQANPLASRTGPIKKAARADEITPGGRAWRHAVAVRLFFQRLDAIYTDGETTGEIIGTVAEALLVKSRVSRALRRTSRDCPSITFFFDGRIQDEPELLTTFAVKAGILACSRNGTYTLPDGQTVRGKEKFRELLTTNEELLTWLRDQVMVVARNAPSDSMYAAAAQEGVVELD